MHTYIIYTVYIYNVQVTFLLNKKFCTYRVDQKVMQPHNMTGMAVYRLDDMDGQQLYNPRKKCHDWHAVICIHFLKDLNLGPPFKDFYAPFWQARCNVLSCLMLWCLFVAKSLACLYIDHAVDILNIS